MSRETTRAATETGQGSIIPRYGDPSDPEINHGHPRAKLAPCRCGGVGEIRPGHYPTWSEIACDTCDRIEFGRTEESAVRKWNFVLSSDSEAEHHGNGETASDQREPIKEGSTDG